MQRAAAVSTGPYTHLDHLGPLAALLEIPLIVTDEKCYLLAKTFYPQAKVIFKEPADLSLEFLAQNFDLLIGCGKYWCLELQPLFELLYRKRMRFVLCPHGNSEKEAGYTSSPQQDIAFIYGEQMDEIMRHNGMMEKVNAAIRIGNYRYPFYRKNQIFYDALAHKKIFFKFAKRRKTILYAPTWSSKEDSTSFLDACEKLISDYASSYNLLIKPHPFVEEEEAAQLSFLHAKHENNPAVAFADGFPAIYPLLAKCAIYMGDFSSVGYDFLAFDRPLYFLHQNEQNPPLIASAGKNVSEFPDDEGSRELEKARKEIYHHAFGDEREFGEIKMELEKISNHKEEGL